MHQPLWKGEDQMRFVYSLRRKPYVLGILTLLLIGFTATGIWHSRATQPKRTDADAAEMKRNFQAEIRKGVGAEVRFANSASSSAQIRDSVDSVASFIQERAGLGMSNATKESLQEMEQTALNSGRRISTTQLSAALAETLTERIATLSDGDIARAEKAFNRSGEHINLRADGRYSMPKESFRSEVQTLRNQLQSGDKAGAGAIQVIVQDVVEERVIVLSEAVGDQFGRAPREGLSPLQALIVTYSVLTDDNLAHSSSNLKQMTLQTLKRPVNNEKAALAFGPKGQVFSTPVHLFFNQEVMGQFLGRLKKGGDE
jgi:hypothetical protein